MPSFNFYVTAKGDSVLGMDLFDAMHGTVHIGNTRFVSEAAVAAVTSSQSSLSPLPQLQSSLQPVSHLQSVSSVTLADYPTITNELGKLKGFVHRPKIDQSNARATAILPSAIGVASADFRGTTPHVMGSLNAL